MVLYIACDDLRILKINNTVKAFKSFGGLFSILRKITAFYSQIKNFAANI